MALLAEVQELKANPNRAGQGTVIEARLDKGRGPVATLLVQNGTLKQGDIIIAGTSVGRVRTMLDYRGNRLTEAGPSVPVEIAGLSEAPVAGAPFFAVADERMARELVEQRKAEERAKAAAPVQKVSLENLFDQIKSGERKELALIVKADVQGSVEAVKASLEKLSNEEVNVRVIHGAVGAINESDVTLAAASNAIIVGFNVRPDSAARESAARQNVDMRMYRVIYDCHRRDRNRYEGYAGSQVPGSGPGPRRGPGDLQGLLRGYRGRLLRAGRLPAPGLLRPCGPGWHRGPRGRPRLPAAVQGLRQGGQGAL